MNNHQIPRAVQWLVSSPQYTLLKTWGSSIYQEEEGIEALDYYKKALPIFTAKLGEEDPRTRDIRHRISIIKMSYL